MSTLSISLVQSDLYWEEKAANLEQFRQIIAATGKASQVVVLPEMFSTGFSMRPEELAEDMEGPTVRWLRDMASAYRKIITGSLIVKENERYYNRLVWMLPNGAFYHYDKRHLFAYAGEDKHYTAGERRLIVSVNGWKISLQICYDLRFPVWARQGRPESAAGRYDMLIYIANWPQRRSTAWKTLLQARAIENQCYVAGVNRTGTDGNQVYHSGDSCLIGPSGEILWQQADVPAVFTTVLDKNALLDIRGRYPFLDDADDFVIL